MRQGSATRTATPQTAPAHKSPALRDGSTPATRPPPPMNGTFTGPPASQRTGSSVLSTGSVTKAPLMGAAQNSYGAAAGAHPRSISPGNGAGVQHSTGSAGYGAGTPSMNEGMPISGYGAATLPSAYGGSFMQPPGAVGTNGDASGAGGVTNPGGVYGNSMYGMQSNGFMYPGAGMGSVYGMLPNMANGMYSSGYGTSMMGPMGAGVTSMYSMGPMGSMGGYGFGSSFGGSLYGGTLYGTAGSLYGVGGSLYGSNNPQAVMSSMYGSRNGSIYGSFGSFYSVEGPHTNLGTVRKYDMPGFSYTFGSNFGAMPYRRNSFTGGGDLGYISKRDNSFRGTSKVLQAAERDPSEENAPHGIRETERVRTEREKQSHQRGASGLNKDGKKVGDDRALGSDGEDRMPELTTKKRSSVEAPQSPPSIRPVKGGATQAVALSSDFRIHSIAVIDQRGNNSTKVTKQGDACVMDGRSYSMDEVLEWKPGEDDPALKSRHIQDMIEHVTAGHNTALLVSHDVNATAAAKATVESTVAKLIDELNKPSRNSYVGVSASMCGLHSNNLIRDLFVSGARLVPIEVGNSPLFGPAVMNTTSVQIKSGDDFKDAFEAALKCGERETLMVCLLTVKQVRDGVASGKDDVFLSSVFIAASRRGPKEFLDIRDKTSTSSPDLFRYAVGGPSVCVHAIAVSQCHTDPHVLSDCAKVSEVQNTAPRSGNVRRFIDFTEEQLKRMHERRNNATGAEKRELDSHVKRLNLILKDAQMLLADPRNTDAPLYRLDSDSTAKTANDASAESPREVSNNASAAATKQDSSKAGAQAEPRDLPMGTVKASPSAPQEDKLHSTKVATVAIVDRYNARAYSVNDLIITAGGRPFTVDEVIQRKDVKDSGLGSKVTDKVLEAFLKGYNGAVVASDSAAVASNGMVSPIMAVVFEAVRRSLAKEGSKGVRVSIALVRDNGKVTDLTNTIGESAVAISDVEVSSSPLFGPVVHNATLHNVRSTDELQRLVDRARASTAAVEWDEHCVVHVTVVHCFAEKSDVFVSSLLVTSASNNTKAYSEVLQQRSSSHSFNDLYRYAFGGAATTAFVVSVGSEDEVTDVVNALGTQNAAGAMRNRTPRQGSINNFISYTATSLQKRREHLATLPDDSAERPTVQKVITSMSRMLEDHKKVTADPGNNFPLTYLAESGASKENDTTPAPQAEKGAAVARDTSPSSAANKGARSHVVPATEGGATKADDAAQHEVPTASCFTEPRVVVFVDRDVLADEKKLSLGDKDYAVDEVVKRTRSGSWSGSSAAVAEIESRLSSVHNCALISASSVTNVSTNKEPVWPIFEQCLRSAMAAGKPGEDVCANLTFSVVSSDEVVADLLADEPLSAPRRLEVASSPIYGPRVNGTATANVQSADELMHVMAKVHERAESQLDAIRYHGAMMVGTAVVRRRTKDGDVEVASLMGVLTGASVKAFNEALNKEQVPRRMLLNCAYGGPSATITILNLKAEDESAQSMVSTAVLLSKKQRNLVSRSGSVLAFVTYTEGTMKRELARSDAATGEMKDRHLQKAERLRPVVEDHKKLLNDFNAPVPAYLSMRSTKPERDAALSTSTSSFGGAPRTPSPGAAAASTPGTKNAQQGSSPVLANNRDSRNSNRIHSVIVITPGRTPADASGPFGAVERVDDTHVKTTIAGVQRERQCDEAVRRVDASSAVRSDLLQAAGQQFVGGFNAALLCCDLGGSNAGTMSCARLVHHAVETKPANSELYFTINGVRNEEARDMMQAGSEYAPLKVANSPVFGPMVHGAAMLPLTEASSFDNSFNTACVAAARDNAMVVVNLVLKTMQDSNGRRDVVVSSFLITLATDPRAYAAVVNAPPKSDRKLFQYAVQGSCFTVGLLGLSDRVGEENLTEGLDIYDKLHTIENRPMRNGSVRRFLAYSMNATADVKQKLPEMTDERQRATYEQRLAQLELMVSDSRTLLESPKGRPLKVYQ